jgi:hypothetical protein
VTVPVGVKPWWPVTAAVSYAETCSTSSPGQAEWVAASSTTAVIVLAVGPTVNGWHPPSEPV